MKNKKYPMIHMGTVSILVVFIILCLVTFALLSYVSAKADYHYADTAAQRNMSYYEACGKAYEKVDVLEQLLIASYSANEQEYYQNVHSALKESEDFILISDSAAKKSPVVTFTIAIDDASVLEVVMQVHWPSQNGDTYYQITGWKEIPSQEWTPQTGMNLM